MFLVHMKIEDTSSLAEADLHLARLIARRSRQVRRLVKAHSLHKARSEQQMHPQVSCVLRIDRQLRDRFRDDVDRIIANLTEIWRTGDDAGRKSALDIVERAVCAWPDETKINAGILRFLAEVIQDAPDDATVLRAWALLRAYTGDSDESLRALVEQRGIALAPLLERVRDGAMRTADHEFALGVNQRLLERTERRAIDPVLERAWLAQLEIFRVMGRAAAGQAFCEKIARRCREGNREDLLDRIAEREAQFRAPREPPLILRIHVAEGRLEIEATGSGALALKERPRQRALLVLAFAYPSGLSLEDAAHMLDLVWRRSSPRWPGPGGKLSLTPPPASLVELSERMAVARDRKVREATENLVTDTMGTCTVGVGAPLLRLVDSRIERDDRHQDRVGA